MTSRQVAQSPRHLVFPGQHNSSLLRARVCVFFSDRTAVHHRGLCYSASPSETALQSATPRRSVGKSSSPAACRGGDEGPAAGSERPDGLAGHFPRKFAGTRCPTRQPRTKRAGRLRRRIGDHYTHLGFFGPRGLAPECTRNSWRCLRPPGCAGAADMWPDGWRPLERVVSPAISRRPALAPRSDCKWTVFRELGSASPACLRTQTGRFVSPGDFYFLEAAAVVADLRRRLFGSFEGGGGTIRAFVVVCKLLWAGLTLAGVSVIR